MSLLNYVVKIYLDIRRVTLSSFLPFIPTAISLLCREGAGPGLGPLEEGEWKSDRLFLCFSPLKCLQFGIHRANKQLLNVLNVPNGFEMGLPFFRAPAKCLLSLACRESMQYYPK